MFGRGPTANIEKASNGGHTVELRKADKPSKKMGMEIGRGYEPPETRVYGPGDHEKMISDVRAHLGLGAKAAPKMAQPTKSAGMGANMALPKV